MGWSPVLLSRCPYLAPLIVPLLNVPRPCSVAPMTFCSGVTQSVRPRWALALCLLLVPSNCVSDCEVRIWNLLFLQEVLAKLEADQAARRLAEGRDVSGGAADLDTSGRTAEPASSESSVVEPGACVEGSVLVQT